MKAMARSFALSLMILVSGGCATNVESLVHMPQVELRDVKVMGLGFSNQTFLLSFSVTNPNPFPLPVNDVTYGLKLDGQRFASGRTPSKFSVPADGVTQFAISVELNLLQTAPRLLAIVRDGNGESLSYELEGEFGIDIPLAPPVAYRHSGSIRIGSGAF